MLNVPDAVKALYKQDRVRKNFRAHFPNGERADITNSDVVQESLHFTESLCSRDVFRFGLAEASVIEFETVGVGNIYGAVMECSIEIDCSSLTAAQISAIQAGTWDGTLVPAADSDRGYAYFRIPLGVFRVDSCPRNHRAMAHRKVTAYAYTYSGGQTPLVSPYMAWHFDSDLSVSNLKSFQSLKRFVDANVGWYRPGILSEAYTKTARYTPTTTTGVIYTREEAVTGGTIKVKLTVYYGTGQSAGNVDTLMAVDVVDFDNSGVFSWIEATVGGFGAEVSPAMAVFLNRWLCLNLVPNFLNDLSADTYLTFSADLPVLYTSPTAIVHIYVPVSAAVDITFTPTGGSAQTESSSFSFTDSYPIQLNNYTPIAADGPYDLPISFGATGSRTTQGGTKFYTYVGAANIADVVLGYIELTGRSYKDDRLGSLKEAALSSADLVSVSPSDYSQGDMWWDEYDVDPIGTVTVAFRNGGAGADPQDITIGPGKSVYDMSDNAALQALSSATLAQVQAMLTDQFLTNAREAGFTPVELTMRGWPWIEAGDALAAESEDGETVNTYALRIELSGIQNLTARITAQGGEIIGED